MPGVLGQTQAGSADEATNAKAEAALLDQARIESAREELASALAKRRTTLENTGEGEETEGETKAEQQQLVDLLEQLDRIYADQLRSLRREADLQAEQRALEEELENEMGPGSALSDQPTFTFLEHRLDERDQAVDARRWADRDREIAEEEMRAAKKGFEDLERERRSMREKSEDNPSTFLVELRLARLRSRLAEETWKLRQHELTMVDLRDGLLAPRMKLLKPEIAWVRAHLVRSDSQRRERERLRSREKERLEQAVAEARDELSDLSADLVRIEQGDSAEPNVLEAWREARRLANQRVSVLSRQLLRVEEFAQIEAQRLAALFGEVDRDTAETWGVKNKSRLQQVENQRRQQISDLVRSRREIQVSRRRLLDAERMSDVLVDALEQRQELLEVWLEICSTEIASLNQLLAGRRRLAEEIGDELPLSLPTLSDAWGGTGDLIMGVWEYELFTVDDQPVRVHTILWVLLLVLTGVLVAQWFSRAAGDVAQSHLKWSRGRAAAWRTLMFYGFMVMIVVTILNLFHFSLTQFSVISGALAVGLGFGSQNLINNFISGIILLIERPIAEGALIELEGEQLWVERIGIRSTVVRSFDNTHIVVPNSRLLEQPVTNWTLSDDVVRQKIRIGVAYGSDTRKASAVIGEVLNRLEPVLADPEPMVLFDAFADSSLEFVAIFHTRLEERFEALTEVRHSLVEALAEAEISIAFPQRDVHLDAVKPFEVHLKRPTRDTADERTGPEAKDTGPADSRGE